MYFDKLINLLSPLGDIDSNSIKRNVELVEKHFKIIFPDDYIQFIMNYGSGQINEFISIYSAINRSAYYEMIERECQNYRNFKKEFPTKYTYSVFPEKEGLFPLGRTDGGCLIWWHKSI